MVLQLPHPAALPARTRNAYAVAGSRGVAGAVTPSLSDKKQILQPVALWESLVDRGGGIIHSHIDMGHS